jgi:hypothetical protein
LTRQRQNREPPVAYVRLQRYGTPDVQAYAAVRPADLPAILAGSDNVVTVQECRLDLAPEITAVLEAQLAAPLRPVMADIGTVAGDIWDTGLLRGQPRPRFWEFRPAGWPLPPGYRCTYISPGGNRCDMLGEGLRQCPAHKPGTRWNALPPDDDDQDDDGA